MECPQDWQERAQHAYQQANYAEAIQLYEQAISANPTVKSWYWHLGLLRLLNEEEAEAQTTWLVGMADGEPEEIEQWSEALWQVLKAEAEQQENLAKHRCAWLIRQYMAEIAPQDLENGLRSLQLALQAQSLTGDALADSGVGELLQAADTAAVDRDLLAFVLQDLLDRLPLETAVLDFAAACLPHLQDRPLALTDALMLAATRAAYAHLHPAIAAGYAELCLHINPNNSEVLRHLAFFYQDAGRYQEGIDMARRCLAVAETLADKVFANHILLRGFATATGYWDESLKVLEQRQSLLTDLIQAWPTNLDEAATLRLFNAGFFFPYFQDEPEQTRPLQNQVARLCQESVQRYARDRVQHYRITASNDGCDRSPNKKLRIGYLSHCLKQHSVGWLARWLFQHHDRQNFEIYTYLINQDPISPFAQQWFVPPSDKAYGFDLMGTEVLEQIHRDRIDILIELDSITLDVLCEALAIKPAPIQATWLGWDASGLPAIDYFLADPYVLPENAQDYYAETILRLPQTYIAVDGFEVGVPTLRRDQLNIPNDATVYFVTQRGYKRHRQHACLQMQIIKSVPNSYFLVKGAADEVATQQFFTEIAEETGVSPDRLRFLPWAPSEFVHRANLGIADVVLDTFPYNGATTTLETLWMGIPLVTKVGKQFSSRNSYTMMLNAGVEEGIAWTDEDYLAWGVRLGKDKHLREQISWKLKQSRYTAPLWDAAKFTREMERAYTQMWRTYLQ